MNAIANLKGGRSLERALRAFCDLALLAELAKLETSISQIIERFGPEALVKGEPTGVRKKLEDDLLARLQGGALIATCMLEAPSRAMRIAQMFEFKTPDRKVVAPDHWMSLAPNFNDSSAKDLMGWTIYDIEVFERDKLVGEARPHGEDRAVAQAQPRAVLFRNGFTEVRVEGRVETFGHIQARVLAELYQAKLVGDGWLNFKALVREAQSNAPTINELFRNKPWRLLIEQGQAESGHAGQLRLRADTVISFQDGALV